MQLSFKFQSEKVVLNLFFTAIQTKLKIKIRPDEKDYCIDNNNNLKVHQKKYLSFRYAVKLQK